MNKKYNDDRDWAEGVEKPLIHKSLIGCTIGAITSMVLFEYSGDTYWQFVSWGFSIGVGILVLKWMWVYYKLKSKV